VRSWTEEFMCAVWERGRVW